ncbi:MAG: hypothetical protein Q8M03_17315, partial [Legionella sp.]|nr:hypothetical protein [Legionella sp.]
VERRPRQTCRAAGLDRGSDLCSGEEPVRCSFPFPAFLLAASLVAGGAGRCAVARAAAAEQPQASLSGVLEMPAAAPRYFPVKDPFRSPIVPQVPQPEEAKKDVELPALLLTAVLQGSGGNAAVVNGVILRTGDAFLDMKVLEISRNRVLFQRGEGKVTIFMQELLYNQHSLGGK